MMLLGFRLGLSELFCGRCGLSFWNICIDVM